MSDYDLGSASEQLMALGPAPELEPLRAHMTVAEYEALVSMLERRIAELEAALLDIANMPTTHDGERIFGDIARRALGGRDE